MFDWLKRLAAVSALAVVAACGGGDDDLDNVVQIAQSNEVDVSQVEVECASHWAA